MLRNTMARILVLTELLNEHFSNKEWSSVSTRVTPTTSRQLNGIAWIDPSADNNSEESNMLAENGANIVGVFCEKE